MGKKIFWNFIFSLVLSISCVFANASIIDISIIGSVPDSPLLNAMGQAGDGIAVLNFSYNTADAPYSVSAGGSADAAFYNLRSIDFRIEKIDSGEVVFQSPFDYRASIMFVNYGDRNDSISVSFYGENLHANYLGTYGSIPAHFMYLPEANFFSHPSNYDNYFYLNYNNTNINVSNLSVSVTAEMPEPSTLALAAAGIFAALGISYRRRT